MCARTQVYPICALRVRAACRDVSFCSFRNQLIIAGLSVRPSAIQRGGSPLRRYFRRMFTSGMRESTDSTIDIPDVRYEVFLCVLKFLYTGKPRDIDPDVAIEVMGAANLFSVEPLKRLCADLIARSVVSVHNVATVLQAADRYQVFQLRQHCINFMVEHFADVCRPCTCMQNVYSIS